MDDIGPANGAVAITPHATNRQPIGIRGLYVGTTGDIVLRAEDSSDDVTFVAVPAGAILPVRAAYIRASGTTADDIVGLI